MLTRLLPISLLTISLAACEPPAADPGTAAPTDAAPVATDTAPADAAAVPSIDVATVLAMPHRTAEHSVRDASRHPSETLEFFGVTSSSTVIELWPGGGWYTEILAPLVRDSGKLIVTNYATDTGKDDYRTKSGTKFAAKLTANPELYDKVDVVTVSDNLVLAPAGTVDAVVTFRNSHGFVGDDTQVSIYKAAFDALKPGGVLGVVQHRANEGVPDLKKSADQGYLPESAVIEAATAAGFQLGEKSEINANPNDTKDYKEGVWTLPPSLTLGDADKAKYEAIGESDRMTLKFVKPAS